MKIYNSLYSIGLAVLVSLALGGQSVDGRDKNDDKKDGKSDDRRGQSSARAHVSSSPAREKQHVSPSPSRSSTSFAQRQQTEQKAPKTFVDRSSQSRSDVDRQRVLSSPRGLQEIVRDKKVAERSQSDRLVRDDKQRDSARRIDTTPKRDSVIVQRDSDRDRSSRVFDSDRNRSSRYVDSGSRRSYEDSGSRRSYVERSTRYRSGGYQHRGVWRHDPSWCPDRSWAWHHRHRYFWNGVWVIGQYPAYGYNPGVYTYDPSPLYPASYTGVAVQRALADRGYYYGPIDGIVGNGTRAAIADFQYDHNMPVSGLIDEELLISLSIG